MKNLYYLLAFLACYFTFGANHIFAQCLCDSEPFEQLCLTSSYCYCDDGYSNPGIFLCESTVIPSAYANNCTACTGASHCIYIILRNEVNCTGTPRCISDIKLHVYKDANSTKFSACSPLKNFGVANTPPLPNWSTPWDMAIGGTPLASSQCVDWGFNTEQTIDCTPPSNSFYICPCDEFTVEVCGADRVSIEITYPNGRNTTFDPSVSLTACPEYGNSEGFCNH